GGMIEWRETGKHKPFLYFLSQIDNNDLNQFTFSGSGGNLYPTRFEYDSFYLGLGSTGPINANTAYHVELVHEFGTGRSTTFNPNNGNPIPQTEEDISAWAAVAGITFLPHDESQSRFEFELIAASGDDDRLDASNTFGGNLPGTDDNAFNAFGFLDTGLALGPDPSNLISFRAGASTNPDLDSELFKNIRVGLDAYLFHKLDADAPLNISTTYDAYIGTELDLSFDWHILSDVTATLRYAIFFPGDALPAAEDDIRQFFYAGVTYAF
ncbi:MAG: alginate export family protein, partial [Planctomycetes bacterium]|nr:alginate export family protein [Planctomycetota bacterium]